MLWIFAAQLNVFRSKISGSDSGVAENSVLPGCYAVSTGKSLFVLMITKL